MLGNSLEIRWTSLLFPLQLFVLLLGKIKLHLGHLVELMKVTLGRDGNRAPAAW